jgi:hypothetical protein
MTDQQAKAVMLAGTPTDLFLIGSVWRWGLRHWQVTDRNQVADGRSGLIFFTRVYLSEGDLRAGTFMTEAHARERMVPVGIMPVGSV